MDSPNSSKRPHSLETEKKVKKQNKSSPLHPSIRFNPYNLCFCTIPFPTHSALFPFFSKIQPTLQLEQPDDDLISVFFFSRRHRAVVFTNDTLGDLDGLRLLVVLLFQVHRVLRYGTNSWNVFVFSCNLFLIIYFTFKYYWHLKLKSFVFVFVWQFFFVLRKKDEHVSLLHVVHHGIMPMSVWFGVRFTPGGHSTFFGLLNTFVHIVMYFYYMVAAMGPQYQKYIWWKKYLTAFQMVSTRLSLFHIPPNG